LALDQVLALAQALALDQVLVLAQAWYPRQALMYSHQMDPEQRIHLLIPMSQHPIPLLHHMLPVHYKPSKQTGIDLVIS
jgi:hypothetical protein